jgi:hypothetical protein
MTTHLHQILLPDGKPLCRPEDGYHRPMTFTTEELERLIDTGLLWGFPIDLNGSTVTTYRYYCHRVLNLNEPKDYAAENDEAYRARGGTYDDEMVAAFKSVDKVTESA